jgi:hypothetical protein
MPATVTKITAPDGTEIKQVEYTPKKKRVLSEKQLAALAANRRRWKKGESGNPQGARVLKNLHEVVLLARQYTTAAITRLGEIIHSNDIPAATRAAEALLDRAWGRAPQVVELTGEGGKPIEQKIVVELPQATTLAPKVMEVLSKLGVVQRVIDVAARQVVANSEDQKLLADYEQLNPGK